MSQPVGKVLADTNEFIKKMIAVTEKNNKATSEHNKSIRYLTKWIVALTIITTISMVLSNCNKTGRYTMSGQPGGVYVLDTKTSEVWLRGGAQGTVTLGTNKKPDIKIFDPDKNIYKKPQKDKKE